MRRRAQTGDRIPDRPIAILPQGAADDVGVLRLKQGKKTGPARCGLQPMRTGVEWRRSGQSAAHTPGPVRRTDPLFMPVSGEADPHGIL